MDHIKSHVSGPIFAVKLNFTKIKTKQHQHVNKSCKITSNKINSRILNLIINK